MLTLQSISEMWLSTTLKAECCLSLASSVTTANNKETIKRKMCAIIDEHINHVNKKVNIAKTTKRFL